MKTSVIISANTEWSIVRELFPIVPPERTPFGECLNLRFGHHDVRVYQGGWGKISAVASAQFILDRDKPDLLVNLGTCGGLKGRIETGMVILVERTLVYDLIDQIPGADSMEYYSTELDLSWLMGVTPSMVIRGLMVSGDRDILSEDVPRLISRHCAIAGDWESAAIAWVASRNETRALILRGVSDLVGEDGGEAYGNHNLFEERAKPVMTHLIDILPVWLQVAEDSWHRRSSIQS